MFYSSFLPKLHYLYEKSSVFLLIAAVFNSTDVLKPCIDRYLNFIWKIALLVVNTVMYHNDVSTSMHYKHRGLRSGTGVIFFLRNAGAGNKHHVELHPTPWKSPSAQQQTHSTPKSPRLLTSRKPGEPNIGGFNVKIMGCRHSSGCWWHASGCLVLARTQVMVFCCTTKIQCLNDLFLSRSDQICL